MECHRETDKSNMEKCMQGNIIFKNGGRILHPHDDNVWMHFEDGDIRERTAR